MEKDRLTQIKLITQALNAASSSVNLAKQLLEELSIEKERIILSSESRVRSEIKKPFDANLPGVVGTYDGQFMVSADGQKHPIPENYASKSLLVYGDKLKRVSVGDEVRFKQIERVKRQRANGVLVKKEGQFRVVTSDGSHHVLSASVSHFGLKEGDEVLLLLPLNNRHSPFAAIEGVPSKITAPTSKVTEEKVEARSLQGGGDNLEKKEPISKAVKKKVPPHKEPMAKAVESTKKEPLPEMSESKQEVPPKKNAGDILIAEDELR